VSKRSKARKAGYDSGTEKELAENELKSAIYHPDPIHYTIPASAHKYTPDFQVGNILVEVKGFLRAGQQNMYKHIARSCEEQGYEFVFLFPNPDKKMPGARKRKNGTWLTLGEWSCKVGITFYTRETIKEIL